MLHPERMQKIALIVHQSDLPALVAELHEAGVVEIKEVDRNITAVAERMKKPRIEARVSSQYIRARRIIDFLEQVKATKAEKEGLLVRLRGDVGGAVARREVEYAGPSKLSTAVEASILEVEGTVKELEEELDAVNERIGKLKEHSSVLSKLEPLGVDLQDLTYHYGRTVVKVGVIDNSRIQELKEHDVAYHIEGIDKKHSVLLILAHRENEGELNKLLERIHLEQLRIPLLEGTPREALDNVQKELEELKRKEQELLDKAYIVAKEKEDDLLVAREQLGIEIEREGVYPFFYKTGRAVVLEAWSPENKYGEVEEISMRAAKGAYYLEKVDAHGEEPPTLLRNPGPVKNFETLTEMYGLPRYNEIDPTIFFAVFYPLVFGFMLGDAFYGIVLAALAYSVGRLIPRSTGWANILLFGALWSVLFGILMSSYFGDFIQRILGGTVPTLWVNPFGTEVPLLMGHPISPIMLILVVSVFFGALHMDIGILISLRHSIEVRHYRRVLGEVGTLILELGLILVLFKFFGVQAITEGMFSAGVKLIAVGVVLIIIRGGPLGFFDTTGFLGDMISYSRILALNMATGGLALAVNVSGIIIVSFMGLVEPGASGVAPLILEKVLQNPLMIIPALILVAILVVGHVVSLVINTLGGAIHTLRLHYAEFFSRFYEGGGAKYTPFRAVRERTILKRGE